MPLYVENLKSNLFLCRLDSDGYTLLVFWWFDFRNLLQIFVHQISPNFVCSTVFNLSRDNSNTQWKLDTRVKFSRGSPGIVGDAKVAHGYLRLGWHFISLIKLFFYNLLYKIFLYIWEECIIWGIIFKRENCKIQYTIHLSTNFYLLSW